MIIATASTTDLKADRWVKDGPRRLPRPVSRGIILGVVLALLLVTHASAWVETVLIMPESKHRNQPFVVQAERTVSEEQARGLVETLKGKGYEPYIFAEESRDGKLWFAVRLGVYDSVSKALQAARTYRDKEQAPAYIASSGSSEPFDIDNLLFYVQIGALKVEENARKMAEEYTRKGYSPRVLELHIDTDPANAWMVVAIGVSDDYDSALTTAKTFRAHEKKSCYVNLIRKDVFDSRLR